MNNPENRPSPDMMNLLHEAALREDALRSYGATPERISADWSRQFGAKIVRQILKEKGASGSIFPPEPETPPTDGLSAWASDFNQKLIDQGGEAGRDRDWRERQFKDD